jgi:hypothetical protein
VTTDQMTQTWNLANNDGNVLAVKSIRQTSSKLDQDTSFQYRLYSITVEGGTDGSTVMRRNATLQQVRANSASAGTSASGIKMHPVTHGSTTVSRQESVLMLMESTIQEVYKFNQPNANCYHQQGQVYDDNTIIVSSKQCAGNAACPGECMADSRPRTVEFNVNNPTDTPVQDVGAASAIITAQASQQVVSKCFTASELNWDENIYAAGRVTTAEIQARMIALSSPYLSVVESWQNGTDLQGGQGEVHCFQVRTVLDCAAQQSILDAGLPATPGISVGVNRQQQYRCCQAGAHETCEDDLKLQLRYLSTDTQQLSMWYYSASPLSVPSGLTVQGPPQDRVRYQRTDPRVCNQRATDPAEAFCAGYRISVMQTSASSMTTNEACLVRAAAAHQRARDTPFAPNRAYAHSATHPALTRGAKLNTDHDETIYAASSLQTSSDFAAGQSPAAESTIVSLDYGPQYLYGRAVFEEAHCNLEANSQCTHGIPTSTGHGTQVDTRQRFGMKCDRRVSVLVGERMLLSERQQVDKQTRFHLSLHFSTGLQSDIQKDCNCYTYNKNGLDAASRTRNGERTQNTDSSVCPVCPISRRAELEDRRAGARRADTSAAPDVFAGALASNDVSVEFDGSLATCQLQCNGSTNAGCGLLWYNGYSQCINPAGEQTQTVVIQADGGTAAGGTGTVLVGSDGRVFTTQTQPADDDSDDKNFLIIIVVLVAIMFCMLMYVARRINIGSRGTTWVAAGTHAAPEIAPRPVEPA